MPRTLATLAALSVIVLSAPANAQLIQAQPPANGYTQPPNGTYTEPFAHAQPLSHAQPLGHVQPLGHAQPYQHGRLDHDYWHHDFHAADVVQLDAYADQLAKVARHLHEDAHKLSQDYEHSESIEHYVDSVDRLQQHMHQILHEAAESGTQSTALTDHVKSDVRQVKNLLNRLYGELQHQGFDGARTTDFRAMVHMRQIVVQEAFPLIRNMEVALYGNTLDDRHSTFYRRPTRSYNWGHPSIGYHH